MRIRVRHLGVVLAAAAVAVATFVAVGPASASVNAGVSASASASAGAGADAATGTPRPCGIKDISFYYGGTFEGLGLRTFDITLLAHDGISCSLLDTPLVTVGNPPSAGKVAVSVGGRGGTLVLRPDSPLHAVVAYNAPDTPEDTSQVNSLTLAMPDGTSASTFFEFPGVTDIATTGGVTVTAWTTGIGPGEEAND